MATYVYELRGSLSNVERDVELIFPNIQSCMAVIARAGGVLVGAHMTVGDRSRVAAVAQAVEDKARVKPTEVYLIGPNTKDWGFAPFTYDGTATLKVCDATSLGYVDVKASLVGTTVRFGIQPNTTNKSQKGRNEFQAIAPTVFRQV